MNLFTRAEIPPATNPGVQMWYDPSNSLGWAPSAARSPAADYDDGNLSVDAGALVLTPGDGGTYAHVVFTVPSNGLYSLVGAFHAQQHNINADVHVLIDGNVKFSQTITNLPESHSFALFLPLSAGTKVNFVVGPNGQPELHAANVGLEAIAARLVGGACAN